MCLKEIKCTDPDNCCFECQCCQELIVTTDLAPAMEDRTVYGIWQNGYFRYRTDPIEFIEWCRKAGINGYLGTQK